MGSSELIRSGKALLYKQFVEQGVMWDRTVIMMGDFNSGMLRPNSYACKLVMVMFEYGLSQVVNGPTRVTEETSTQIDLLFTIDVELVHKDVTGLV